jgi:hypothetical protein
MASVGEHGTHRRQRVRIAVGITALGIAIAAIASCSGGNSSTSAAHRAASVPGGSTADFGGALPMPAEPMASATANSAAGSLGTAAKPGSLTSSADLLTSDRSLVRTAEITVRVPHSQDVGSVADHAAAIAAGVNGAVFSDDRTTGTSARATLVLTVPPNSLTTVLTSLSKLGVEVGRQLSTDDVTTQVADVNARLTSATASITRLDELFIRASKVGDIIALESELATREADKESLQAQQKALASETQTAKITLELVTKTAAVAVHHHHQNAVVHAISRGWHHFTDFGTWLIGALAAIVPFSVLVLVLFSLWIGLGRVRRMRRPEVDHSPAAS